MRETGRQFMPSFDHYAVANWHRERTMPLRTAPAERQRRRHFGWAWKVWIALGASQSGVALRFPPQSKTWRPFGRVMDRERDNANLRPKPSGMSSPAGVRGINSALRQSPRRGRPAASLGDGPMINVPSVAAEAEVGEMRINRAGAAADIHHAEAFGVGEVKRRIHAAAGEID